MSLDTAARMQDVPSGKSWAAAPRPLFGQTLDGRVVLHDIEHLVTGFGPNPAGEVALAVCNVAATARYFTPASAQYFSHATYFVSSASFARSRARLGLDDRSNNRLRNSGPLGAKPDNCGSPQL